MSRPPGPNGRLELTDIDRGTGGLHLAQVRQPTGILLPRGRDELSPIARWMAHEMNRNAGGADALRIRELNQFSAVDCMATVRDWPWWQRMLAQGQVNRSCMDQAMTSKPAALLAWGLKVRQDGDWDHKPQIARRFNPANPGGEQHYHRYGNTLYFYDVWSNVHYGYVGRACGFGADELLDGAGVEQIASDLLRGSRPQASAGVQGMRRFDHAQDRVAVELGIDLFRVHPQGIEATGLLSAIVARRFQLVTRAYSP